MDNFATSITEDLIVSCLATVPSIDVRKPITEVAPIKLPQMTSFLMNNNSSLKRIEERYLLKNIKKNYRHFPARSTFNLVVSFVEFSLIFKWLVVALDNMGRTENRILNETDFYKFKNKIFQTVSLWSNIAVTAAEISGKDFFTFFSCPGLNFPVFTRTPWIPTASAPKTSST